MTQLNRASTYAGYASPAISTRTIEQVIRESAGQQIPPGAVPEDRVAPSTQDGDVTTTVDGKTQWIPSDQLPGVVAVAGSAAAAQQAADDAAAAAAIADAAAAAAANDAAAAQDAADTVATDLLDHLADTSNAHDASAIRSVATGDVAATDVQGAIAELAAEKATTGSVTGVSNVLTAHIDQASGAHAAGAISVTETGIIIPGTSDVQTALRNVEAYMQNLEERFEQHHHDDRYLKRPHCARLYYANSQSIAENTWTKVTAGCTKHFETTQGMTDTTNATITIPESGLYEINVCCRWVAPGVNVQGALHRAFVTASGTELTHGGGPVFAGPVAAFRSSNSAIWPLNAGVVVELNAYWYAGVGGTYAVLGGSQAVYLEVTYLGPQP